MSVSLFWPGATSTINATTTTSSIALARTGGKVVRLANVGSVAVFIAFGDNTVTATVANGMPILPGTVELFAMAQIRAGSSTSPTYFAAITESSTARISATVGEGEL